MKPNPQYLGKPPRFWAHAKFVSEQIGYSDRKTRQLRKYDVAAAQTELKNQGLVGDTAVLSDVVQYLNWRTDVLNNHVAKCFMDRAQAAKAYAQVRKETGSERPPVMNKQKGKKKHPAYLTCMVSMFAESVLGKDGFVDDARRLAFVAANGRLEEIFSRRFDGAVPSIENPRAVWEIKEYYGTTTFGSRVADGVYETLLDGHELNGVRARMKRQIQHFLFIDDRYTWWDCGRSYLCRLIDLLHTGHVDEIFFGREVLEDWSARLKALQE